jgi:hypothetical protein
MRHRRAQRIRVDVLRGPANDGLGNLLGAQVDIGRAGRVSARALTVRGRGTVRAAVSRRRRDGGGAGAGAAVQGVGPGAAVVGRGLVGARDRAAGAVQAPAARAAVGCPPRVDRGPER